MPPRAADHGGRVEQVEQWQATAHVGVSLERRVAVGFGLALGQVLVTSPAYPLTDIILIIGSA